MKYKKHHYLCRTLFVQQIKCGGGNMVNTIEITSSEFRQNQKKFFDLAAKGTSVIIYRGKELFKISHVDTKKVFDDETMKQIEESLNEAARGEVTVCKTYEDSIKHLNSL